ncbi:MAG TPA: double zinc ribbon domain-containing protein [Gaiellaceae bacterium]|nr:double zinc ribbon domain-containing protein [Gaiellaceae bacterium]
MLDVLLPRRCLVCGAGGALLCGGCRSGLPRLEPPLCDLCGAPVAWPVRRCCECGGRRIAFAVARAAVPYDDAVRRLVAGWKERGLRRLAEEAAALVAERIERPDAARVTFVPADRARRLERGHHPAEQLARTLAERWRLPAEALLRRTRTAPRQRGLTLRERRRNAAGAFSAAQGIGGTVVLVDDVYTTGATASAAAAALRAAGAARVEVVTFARTVRSRGYG